MGESFPYNLYDISTYYTLIGRMQKFRKIKPIVYDVEVFIYRIVVCENIFSDLNITRTNHT